MKLVQGFTNTQPLWRGTQFGIPQFRLPSIDLRTFTPTPIPTKLRLGHQVEQVFLQLLESHPDYTILAHSLQIKRNKQTIGELDFLVRYKEQLYHIELSCKFYLIDPSITESIHCLVGPNRSDAFFKKIEKTQQKQLPLLYSEECLQQLHALDIDPSQIKQEVCFLARLYAPIKGTLPSIEPLNKQCITGIWVPMSHFSNGASLGWNQSMYYIPIKSEWLYEPHEEVTWLSYENTVQLVQTSLLNKKSPMLWRKTPDGLLDTLFVVWW